jgi:hypothetical protein
MTRHRALFTVLAGVLCLAGPAWSQQYTVSHFAGNPGGFGVADGPGSVGRFGSPAGVAIDSAGTLYIADLGNHTIRSVSPAGVVSTLAGSPGQPGYVDGDGAQARFFQPWGIAVDAARNVYVADMTNRVIRKVTPAGEVTTLAGSQSAPPEVVDGTGAAAHFASVMDIAACPDGTFLITDMDGHVVRRMTPDGAVTTVAGLAGHFGSVDGVGSLARFAAPFGITVGPDGVAFVADSNAGVIRRIALDTTVTTLAGGHGLRDYVDGTGGAARFLSPRGITHGPGGVLFVTDGNAVRAVTLAGVVTTVVGAAFAAGANDGQGLAARFNFPTGIAADAAGNFFVAEGNNHTLRTIDAGLNVSTLAGAAPKPAGYLNGFVADARFDQFSAVAVHPDGDLFVADLAHGAIRRITPAGDVSTFAGVPEDPAHCRWPALGIARFTQVLSLAFAPDGTLYLYELHRLRAISPEGVVRTVAGDAEPGTADGHGGRREVRRVGGERACRGSRRHGLHRRRDERHDPASLAHRRRHDVARPGR